MPLLSNLTSNTSASLFEVATSPEENLRRGASEQNRIMIETALAAGADINSKNQLGYAALHLAALTGNIDICDLLINHGADLTSRTSSTNKTAQYLAYSAEHLACSFFLGKQKQALPYKYSPER
jgi:ankyrin repeat protein